MTRRAHSQPTARPNKDNAKRDLFLDERSGLKFILRRGSHRCSDLTNILGTVGLYLCWVSKVRPAINLVKSGGGNALAKLSRGCQAAHVKDTSFRLSLLRGCGSQKAAWVSEKKKREANTLNKKICLKYRPGLSSRKNCFIRVSHKCHFESTMRGGKKKYTALNHRPSSEPHGSGNHAASRGAAL